MRGTVVREGSGRTTAPRQRRASVGVALLAFLATAAPGCSTWRTIELASEPLPERIRVRDSDARWVEVRQPRVEGDSVVAGLSGDMDGVVRIRLRSVRGSEGRFPNPAGTLTLVLATPVVAVILLAVAYRDATYTIAPGR